MEWPDQREFEEGLNELGGNLSANRIKHLAALAVKDYKHYKFVVHSVERHIKATSRKTSLASVCVIDAIFHSSAKQFGHKDPFPARFGKNLPRILQLLFSCDSKYWPKIIRFLKLWREGKKFPREVRSVLDDYISKFDRSSRDARSRHGVAANSNATQLLSSLDSLDQPTPASAAARSSSATDDFDDLVGGFDYGDEEDDDERIAEQKRRLEEQKHRLEMEEEVKRRHEEEENQKALQRKEMERLEEDRRRQSSMSNSSPSLVNSGAGIPRSAAEMSTSRSAGDTHHDFIRDPNQAGVPQGYCRVLSTTVYIGGVPETTTPAELHKMFSLNGVTLADVKMVNKSVFARYVDREDAETAKDLISSYHPEFRTGYGRPQGLVFSGDMDQRNGTGLCTLDSVQTAESRPPRRPSHASAPPPPPPPPRRPAAYGHASVAGPPPMPSCPAGPLPPMAGPPRPPPGGPPPPRFPPGPPAQGPPPAHHMSPASGPPQFYAPPPQGYAPPPQGYAPPPQRYAPPPQAYAAPSSAMSPPNPSQPPPSTAANAAESASSDMPDISQAPPNMNPERWLMQQMQMKLGPPGPTDEDFLKPKGGSNRYQPYGKRNRGRDRSRGR